MSQTVRRFPVPVSRPLIAVLLGFALATAPFHLVADEPAVDEKAEADLKKLEDRAKEASGERDKLVHDLIDFRVAHPGTTYAVRAAVLLSQQPTPSDRLDPTGIPEIERFKWQPKELVAVIGEHRGRQGGIVTCVAVSPDGKMLASGGAHLVRLWKTSDMRLQAVVSHYGVDSVAFSSDGKVLASGGTDGYVRIWDLKQDEDPKMRYAILAGASTPVAAVAFAPDGKSVAAGCADNNVRVFDVSGAEAKDLATVSNHEQGVTSVVYTPDGKTLISGSSDKTVRLWTVTDKGNLEQHAVLEPVGDKPTDKPPAVQSLALARGGELLAVGCADGTIHLWNMPAGSKTKERVVLPPTGGLVYSLSFSSTGKTLAAACADGTVRLWPTGGGMKEIHKLPGHPGYASSVVFSPDDKMVYSGGSDWVVRLWELGTKPTEKFQPASHLSAIYAVGFAPDGKTLATGSEDHSLRLWDLTASPLRTRNYTPPAADAFSLYGLTFTADGKYLAAGGNSTTARLYESGTGKMIRTFAGHPAGVTGLAFTPDGKALLTSSAKTLILWDVAKGLETHRFKEHETNLTCMALSPDGRTALSGSGYYLYKDGKIALDKENHYIYTDCVLRMWDVESATELDCLPPQKTPLVGAAYSPTSGRVFTGVSEPILRQWDATKPPLKEVATMAGTYGAPSVILPSPDGKTVLTRGLDGTVIVWDLAGGKRLQEWTLNESVAGAAWSADSRHVAIGLYTGVVYVLRLGPPEKAGK